MKFIKPLFICLLIFPQSLLGQLSPSEFLGYELGERFTQHHRVIDYFNHIAGELNHVEINQYGESYEHRPLVTAFLSSPENIERLEGIRRNNLRLAGLADGEPSENTIAIVWLAYNIHGNESSSSEAAMQTLYDLSDPNNATTNEWLENTLVIIDPNMNPDGRERYVNWYNQIKGKVHDPRSETREHSEPWPSGRYNHYYFDLNRDWAWGSQQETQYRTKLFQKWMPHVHVDFHEMGANSPYYFAPAAEPFHEDITDWQREIQTEIGRNHARYFDEIGSLYYTREIFDLLYPSYGDTWPTFNGSIGMTYEQGGSGTAGLAIQTTEGDTLTLKERIEHHHLSGLSTVEAVSKRSAEVVRNFREYFLRSTNNPDSQYKTYIIRSTNTPDKLRAFTEYLDSQNIQYGYAPQIRSVSAYNYETTETNNIQLNSNDILISAFQPKSVLLKVLLEPQATITDSLTYDITAWSLPYAYGLETYALTQRVNPISMDVSFEKAAHINDDVETPYAYINTWKSFKDAEFLATLLKLNIRVRFNEKPFTLDGREYDEGTLVITRAGNEKHGEDFDHIVRKTALEFNRQLIASPTGFVDEGIDFGSNHMKHLRAPQVALITGESTSPPRVGEVWHYFDQQINYPLALINSHQLNRVNYDDYDVFILPRGNYNKILNSNEYDRMMEWVSRGGKIIALENAISFLAGNEALAIPKKIVEKTEGDQDDAHEKLRRYGDRQREALKGVVRGSIFKLQIDHSHPLGFGYDSLYYTLKNNASTWTYLNSGWNVGILRENAHLSGFVGSDIKGQLEETLVFGVLPHGSGQIILMNDNPLFRGFWYNGKLLFANAVFMVGN
ncbi:MAG: M14 family metallopeptidase [Balneolales bacterium]